MKEQILQVIEQRGDLALTAFKHHIPEIKGEYDFLFPSKGIEISNILLFSEVSEGFISEMSELITAEILTFEPCSIFVVSADGGEAYDLPIVEEKKSAYETLHWLPLLIKKGKNFPKKR